MIWRSFLRGALLLTALALAACCPALAAAAGATWRFAPALAPPPPPGVQAAPYPVALGPVGDIEFWAPNRGVLVTAGNEGGTPVPMGVYAYDGASWHQLSTVCGGSHGRIAWAGPEEFWTIADQRAGQAVGNGSSQLLEDVSLCHFENGQVVGSYATPLGQPNSYLPMNAAACLSSSNCWFGGGLGQYPNTGSFHLHWDGQSVTTMYDANAHDDHAIGSMAGYGSTLYEGVQLARTDAFGGVSAGETPVVHTINAGAANAFGDVPLKAAPACSGLCAALPEYDGVDAATLPGLLLASDAGLSGSARASTQMWALAGPPREGFPGFDSDAPVVLHCGNDSTYEAGGRVYDCGSDVWQQAPSSLLPGGEQITGLAAEPGGDSAWVALQAHDGAAHVDRITVAEHGGTQTASREAQDVLGLGGLESEMGDRGNAGAMACPAANDCWLATDEGWLYHYGDGAGEPQDGDPNFAGVITFRPPDEGIPLLIADVPPADDSLANQQPPPPPPPPPAVQVGAGETIQLVKDVRSRLIHRYTLQLTFTLAAQAHVQLLASRGGHLVAHTPRRTLKAGHVKLLLPLNPRRWPTKLDLRATPLQPLPSAPAGSGPQSAGGSPISGPIGSNNVST